VTEIIIPQNIPQFSIRVYLLFVIQIRSRAIIIASKLTDYFQIKVSGTKLKILSTQRTS